jgi:hypothetical protein
MTPKAIPNFAPVERPLEFDFASGAGVAVDVWEEVLEDIEDEVLLELLKVELMLLLLVLLWELEDDNLDDSRLEVGVTLGVVCRDIVVGVLKITSVTPDITVVRPDNEKAELTGTTTN